MPDTLYLAALRDAMARDTCAKAVALVGQEHVHAQLTRTLERELSRCADMDFARMFAHHCPVRGVDPAAYLHQLIHYEEHILLAGIRFKGGDLAYPFIDLLASTLSMDDAPTCSLALKVVLERFSAFAPRAVRIFHASDLMPTLPNFQSELDQLIMAGRVAEMCPSSSLVTETPEVSLRDVVELDAALAFIDDMYAQTFQATPSLEGTIFPATREDLDESSASGLLTWIIYEETIVGLISTYMHDAPMLRGPCMLEEIIAPAWRGRGFAAQAQRLLAARLHTPAPHEILWGTIDASNVASLRTAQRAGRHAIAAWSWLAYLTKY